MNRAVLVSPRRKLQKQSRKVEARRFRRDLVTLPCVQFSVGWLNISLPIHISEASWLLDLLELSESFTENNRPWRGYPASASAASGVQIGFETGEAGGMHISIPAEHLARWSWSRLRAIFRRLLEVEGLRVGRIDLTNDDLRRQVELPSVVQHSDAGNAVTRSKIKPHIEIRPRGGSILTGCSFGSRKSDSYLRVYDKYLEGMAKRREYLENFIRWELELKNERALAALKDLVQLEEWDCPAFVWGLVRGVVDFRQRDADSNVSRCPLLGWWDALVSSADKVRLRIPKAADTLERVTTWLERATMPLLAVTLRVRGLSWLLAALQQGVIRWRPRHTALLRAGMIGET